MNKEQYLNDYMDRNNIDLHYELLIGSNPFEETDSFPFMRVVCDMLVNNRQFSWRTLRIRYEQEFGWTQAESYPHIRIVTDILEDRRIIQDIGGLFVLNRVTAVRKTKVA